MQDPAYLTWREGDETSSQLLCIYGPPGFGKSIILTCIIQQLNEIQKLSRIGSDQDILYFYFRKGDEMSSQIDHCLASLAGQVFSEDCAHSEADMMLFLNALAVINGINVEESSQTLQAEQDIDVDQEIVDEEDAKILDRKEIRVQTHITLSLTFLQRLLTRLSEKLNRTIYIIVDAIDECDDTNYAEIIGWLYDLANSKSSHIRVVLSCRDSINLENVLCDHKKISSEDTRSNTLSQSNSQEDCDEASEVDIADGYLIYKVNAERNLTDMRLFLESEVSELMKRRWCDEINSSSYQKELEYTVKTILNKANGMFTYASMVVAQLRQPYSMSLKNKLRKLPEGMNALYTKSLQSLTHEEQVLVQLALQSTVFGQGTISMIEIIQRYKRTYLTEKSDSLEDDQDNFGTEDQDDVSDHEDHTMTHDEGPKNIDIEDEVDKKDSESLYERFLEASRDPDIIDTMHYLQKAGREFFRFNLQKFQIELIHKSVRDWVESESEAQALSDRIALQPAYALNERGQLVLTLPLPCWSHENKVCI